MKPNQQSVSEYSTRDIYVSSVLKQLGLPLLRVENNGRQGIFVFEASETVKEVIRKYFNGELRVDPRSLFENWKSLKSMAFASIGDTR